METTMQPFKKKTEYLWEARKTENSTSDPLLTLEFADFITKQLTEQNTWRVH